jgi:hypothetical protein
LRAIYERHLGGFKASRATSKTGVFLPIDIPAIATLLRSDNDTVFGRLHHHLDPIYSEAPRDGKPQRRFFKQRLEVGMGYEPNCINFPLLEAVLAGLWQENNRQLLAVGVSVLSIAIALAALIVSIAT